MFTTEILFDKTLSTPQLHKKKDQQKLTPFRSFRSGSASDFGQVANFFFLLRTRAIGSIFPAGRKWPHPDLDRPTTVVSFFFNLHNPEMFKPATPESVPSPAEGSVRIALRNGFFSVVVGWTLGSAFFCVLSVLRLCYFD